MSSIRVVRDGYWSGGGNSLLNNISLAEARFPHIFNGGDDSLPFVVRNSIPFEFIVRSQKILYLPQNAWAWHGPIHKNEVVRRAVLRMSSEVAFRHAVGVLRIGPMIPDHPKTIGGIIPNVLDEEFEESLHQLDLVEKKGGKNFYVSGSIWSYRNLELVLNAFELYRKQYCPDATLLIRGRCHKPHYLRSLKQCTPMIGVKIDDRFVSRSENLTQMAKADAVIFPSLVEASPVSILEAIAVGAHMIVGDNLAHKVMCESGGVSWDKVSKFKTSTDLVKALSSSAACGEYESFLRTSEGRAAARERWIDLFVDKCKEAIIRGK